MKKTTSVGLPELKAAPAEPIGSDSRIRVGIGGWTYVPWRGGSFYPADLVQRRELEYASRQLTSIEVNGTYYRAQKPATYVKWRDETPEHFVFSVKAPKRIVGSKVLSKTAYQVEDFIGGIVELGTKLGPLVWQFDQGKPIDASEFEAFIESLPAVYGKWKLRHVLDVRDPDFVDTDDLAIAGKHGMATVFTDSTEHPSFADLTTDFVYARLMRSRSTIETGYPDPELASWCDCALRWASGEDPEELPHLGEPLQAAKPRDVFVYFISGAKERNPAAAIALLKRLAARRP